MPKSIDPKSFIIGVLSAIVVCMARGADRSDDREWLKKYIKNTYTSQTFDNWDTEQFWEIKITDTMGILPGDQIKVKGWQPFGVTELRNNNFLYHYRRPKVNHVKD